MEFAWKIKSNFLSTSSKSWNSRGRPKRIDDKIEKKSKNGRSIDANFSKDQYSNICINLSSLHSRSYIDDAQLEAGCIFHILAYNAKNFSMPTYKCSLSSFSKKTLSKSASFFLSEKKEKIIKKYMRIKKLLAQESSDIERVIERIVVQDMEIRQDPRRDAMKYEISSLKRGLDIIHDYLNESYYHAFLRKK